MSAANRLPIIGYASVILCLIIVLLWQNSRIAGAERALDAAALPGQQANMQSLPERMERLSSAQARMDSVYSQARRTMKFGFLLLVVLPAAVIFPVMMISKEDAQPPKKASRVVHVDSMTLDDVDRGVPDDLLRGQSNPQRDLFVVNGLAFAIPTFILILFAMLKPEAYGGLYPNGIQSILLFLVGTLIAFSGMAMAYPLKKSASPRQIQSILGSGFVVLALLAWFFL